MKESGSRPVMENFHRLLAPQGPQGSPSRTDLIEGSVEWCKGGQSATRHVCEQFGATSTPCASATASHSAKCGHVEVELGEGGISPELVKTISELVAEEVGNKCFSTSNSTDQKREESLDTLKQRLENATSLVSKLQASLTGREKVANLADKKSQDLTEMLKAGKAKTAAADQKAKTLKRKLKVAVSEKSNTTMAVSEKNVTADFRNPKCKSTERFCRPSIDFEDTNTRKNLFLAIHGFNVHGKSTVITARAWANATNWNATDKNWTKYCGQRCAKYFSDMDTFLHTAKAVKPLNFCNEKCQKKAKAKVTFIKPALKNYKKNVMRLKTFMTPDKIPDEVCLPNAVVFDPQTGKDEKGYNHLASQYLTSMTCRGSCCMTKEDKARQGKHLKTGKERNHALTQGQCVCNTGCYDGVHAPFFTLTGIRIRMYVLFTTLFKTYAIGQSMLCDQIPNPETLTPQGGCKGTRWCPMNIVPKRHKECPYKKPYDDYWCESRITRKHGGLCEIKAATKKAKHETAAAKRKGTEGVTTRGKRGEGSTDEPTLGEGLDKKGSKPGGSVCKKDVECESGTCKGNWGGRKSGKCTLPTPDARSKPGGSVCKKDVECESGTCKGNWGGRKSGKCTLPTPDARSKENGTRCKKDIECKSGHCNGNLHGVKHGTCSKNSLIQQAGGTIKSAAMAGGSNLMKHLIAMGIEYVPCEIRSQLDGVTASLETLDINGAFKAFSKVYVKVISFLFPAFVGYYMRHMLQIVNFAKFMQTGCSRARTVMPAGHTITTFGLRSEVAGDDWKPYKKPEQMSMYFMLAKNSWLESLSKAAVAAGTPGKGLYSLTCLDPMHNCVPKWPEGKGPKCLMKTIMTMKVCNTCCCKGGDTVASVATTLEGWGGRLEDQGTPSECGAWFSFVDALVRAIFGLVRNIVTSVQLYPRCWRGTLPYSSADTVPYSASADTVPV